ncbi:MAG: hypothetical protein FJW34_22110 [Acidobacteria bacterium]|nr:hypothetical protein [Acidobacteriota bacterium]
MKTARKWFPLDPGDWLAVKPKLDPQATALEIRYSPGRFEVRLRIGVGLLVLGIFSTIVYFSGGDVFTIFITFGLGLFGLLNLIYGVIQSGFSMYLLITASEVAVDRKTLLGRRQWREWLNRYRGVVLRERQVRESDVGTMAWGTHYHIIELAHDDPAKTVPLYVQESGAPPRHIQEAFARRFGLPALSPDSSGEIARQVAELGRSLSEQGAVVPDPGRPPSGVQLRQRNGTTRLTIGNTRLGQSLVWLFWVALPLVFGALVYQLDPIMGYVAAGMAALLVLTILGIGKLMGRKEEDQRAICIDGERVWIVQGERREPALAGLMRRTVSRVSGVELPGLPSAPPSSLPRSAIEQVRVDRYTSHGAGGGGFQDDDDGPTFHPRLLIEGKAGTLEYIAAQFDRKKLEWIRDYLRYRLANRT